MILQAILIAFTGMCEPTLTSTIWLDYFKDFKSTPFPGMSNNAILHFCVDWCTRTFYPLYLYIFSFMIFR